MYLSASRTFLKHQCFSYASCEPMILTCRQKSSTETKCLLKTRCEAITNNSSSNEYYLPLIYRAIVLVAFRLVISARAIGVRAVHELENLSYALQIFNRAFVDEYTPFEPVDLEGTGL